MSYYKRFREFLNGMIIELPCPELTEKENARLAGLMQTRQDAEDLPYCETEED